MSRNDFITAFESEKITLAWVHGSERLYTWTLDTAAIYKRSVPHFVYTLKQDTVALTRVSTYAALVEGSFFFDPLTQELYVWTNGSTNPQGNEEMIVTYRFFFGSADVSAPWDLSDTETHVQYEGRIQLSPGYKHKIAVEQNLVSVIGNGTLKLHNNDGTLDEIYDSIIFDNHTVQIFSWTRELAYSLARVIYKGRVTNKRFQEDNVSFLVKDLLFDLDQRIPQGVYDDTDNVADSVKGRAKRWVYGRVDGMQVQSTDQIAEGYPLTGTVSLLTVDDPTLVGSGTQFLSECSPGDKIKIATMEFTISSVDSDQHMTLNDTPDYLQSGVTATIIPEIPTVVKNRNFFVTDHACVKLTKTVVSVLQFNRVVVNDTDDLAPGDMVEFTTSGERIEIEKIAPGNVLVLRKNIVTPPTVGSFVIRQPVQNVYVGKEIALDSKYTISTVGAPTDETRITLTSDLEFTLADNQRLGINLQFINGQRHALYTGEVSLNELLSARDYIRPVDVNFSTYYEILGISDSYVLTGTVFSAGIDPQIQGIGTLFSSELKTGDSISYRGEEFTVKVTGLQLSGTISGTAGTNAITGSGTNFTILTPGQVIEIEDDLRYTIDVITDATNMTVTTNLVNNVSGADFGVVSNTILTTDSVPAFNNQTPTVLRKVVGGVVEFRLPFADPNHTGSTEGKLPEYIGDNTIISADVLGKTVDGEPNGAFIRTAAETMRDLIREAGILDVNEQSFVDGAAVNSQLISMALPFTPTGEGVDYKSAIDKLARSVTATLTLDNDLNLKYKAINTEFPTDPIEIGDFDVVSWDIETINGKNIRNSIVNYRFVDVDRATQEEGNKTVTFSSEFVEKYVGTNKTEELDVYLYNDKDAEILSHRNTYLHSLGRTDIKITTDLRFEDVEIGDTIILNFRRVYKRFGDPTSRQKAVLVVGKTLNGERTILELSDLGNVFNRSSVITPDAAPDFSAATEKERLTYGYITQNDGIVDNDESTSNTHLIS